LSTRTAIQTAASLTLIFLLLACNKGGLSSEQKKSAEDALKALRKVEAATEAGVSFMNYQPLVIDAKAQVNEASSKLPDEELKKELGAAMEAYMDAGLAWNQFARDRYLDNYSEPGKTLAAKYPIDISFAHPAVQTKSVLSTIWNEAGKHVERASKLLGE